MARAPSKHGRDEALDFQGILSDLQDWELSLKDKEKDKKLRAQASDKEVSVSSQKTGTAGYDRKPAGKSSTLDYLSSSTQYGYSRNYDSTNRMPSSSVSEDTFADATSEKELGNEYFKQKKFKEAIDCYSRSIAFSPTAVAYANRALAYLKVKRQEAEDDCTEALNMDDRYIKAYSRRATARKELGKLKECIEDAEFALHLEPQNQEIKKQYSEAKSFYEKVIHQKTSTALENTIQKMQKVEKKDTKVNSHRVQPFESATQKTEAPAAQDFTKRKQVARKQELKESVQELASRAASQAMAETAKNISPPTSAYQFEVSWQGLSGDRALQARLLKAISPGALPQIFKNALTVPVLVDIVKCLASFFSEEMDLAVSFLENLTKVPRFSIIAMCLTSADRSVSLLADLVKIWNEVFCGEATPIEYAEMVDNLRSKYCLKQ
ncbi:N-terminal acetyltransferase A, auxiliary subunit [Parasponia andersonii]|uniref:N-terminal acetyltransferase A, auxiliary subunit n=1 Tax=Parasponia andersonii TaxID=3476 RepID=A0A2P5BHD8_PARAD|nr:N-terminal acetyltransferase A, auxiliary subunit [Parasponia andersonii]